MLRDEEKMLQGMLSEMENITNAIPNERFVMNESDTLIILQRRMESSDLKTELRTFCDVFSKEPGPDLDMLSEAALAYIKVKVLIEAEASNFTPILHRELIRALKEKSEKVKNIIEISKINALIVDDFQKENIARTVEKNEAFLARFEREVNILESKLEEDAVVEETTEDEPVELPEPVTFVRKKEEKKSFWSRWRKNQDDTEIAVIEENLSDDNMIPSIIEDTEIPSEILSYEKKLAANKILVCKDIPQFSLLFRKNRTYFGYSKNIRKGVYDNVDGSLLELTAVNTEFIQYMTEDLLKQDYKNRVITNLEKEALFRYFSFMSDCFSKNMGTVLSVNEYMEFMEYYSRLFALIERCEREERANNAQARLLAEDYLFYMKGYGIKEEEFQDEVAENILFGKSKRYVDNLHRIKKDYVTNDMAKMDIDILCQKMGYKSVSEETRAENEIPDEPEVNQGQIIVQILDRDRNILDEAVYASSNMEQAQADFVRKDACIKRMGFRNEGQEVFFREEIDT